MKTENTDELIALQKALMFIKFITEDSEARYLAASPLLGTLLKNIRIALQPYFTSKGINYSIHYGDIESHPEYIEAVRRHIFNIPNWQDYDQLTQKEIILTLCEPFNVDANTVNKLVTERSI